jgi:hypothetical protein
MAIDYYPYDYATAHRPSLDDLGGDQKLEDTGAPPLAGDPRACEWNNFSRLHAAFARMLPAARVTVNFAAGAPFVETLLSMGTELAATDFTVTDNGTGDTTLTWAVGKLPSMSAQPTASCHVASRLASAWAPTGLSVRVATYDAGGIAQDSRVTVDIY